MIKLLFTFVCFATLSACAQFGDRKSEGVVAISSSDLSYSTQCNGAFDEWASCSKRADKTCATGWSTIDRVERPNNQRTLMFQCYR